MNRGLMNRTTIGEDIVRSMNEIGSYKLIAPGYRQRMRYVLRMLDPGPGEFILEVGCGGGEYSFVVGKTGATLVSMDIRREDIRIARERARDLKVSLLIADAQAMPFKGAIFDKAFSTEVLEHIRDDKAAANGISRSLKRGGTCIIDVPAEETPFFRDPINFMLRKLGIKQIRLGGRAWGHYRHYTNESIRELVERSGLEIEENVTTGHGIVSLTHFYLPEIYTFIIMPVLRGKPKCIKRPPAVGSMYRTLTRISDFICRMDEGLSGPGGGICIKAVKVQRCGKG